MSGPGASRTSWWPSAFRISSSRSRDSAASRRSRSSEKIAESSIEIPRKTNATIRCSKL